MKKIYMILVAITALTMTALGQNWYTLDVGDYVNPTEVYDGALFDMAPSRFQNTDQVLPPVLQGYTSDDIPGYGVAIYPQTPGSDIMYRISVSDDVDDVGNEEWMLDTDWTEYKNIPYEIWRTQVGKVYRVDAYAYIGDVTSDTFSYWFLIDYSGLNEIANGKSIAGVRYFNMAGQEIPEANGLTIVVTTYTDGTTSAAKVVK